MSEKLPLLEIVNKLVGPINPVGETNTDNDRLENLKNLCELVNDLVSAIDEVGYRNKDSFEHSRKAAAGYAENFLSKTLNIQP